MTDSCTDLSRAGRFWPRQCLALWLWAGLAAGATGQPAAPNVPQLPAGIQVSANARPQTATVGDPITIDVDVTLPPGYRVLMPKPATQLGDFTLLEFAPSTKPDGTIPAATAVPPGTHERFRLSVAVYRTGAFTLPRLPLTVVAGDGKEIEAKTPEIGITIRSVLEEKDTELRGLKKQAEMEEPFPWRAWLAAGAALLLCSAAAWRLLRRRRRIVIPPAPGMPQLAPLDLAEIELRELAARGLPEKGMMKAFYVAISDIVRKILEGGFAVTTSEKTTTEIVEALRERGRPHPDSERLESIEALLTECDLVKFARFVPPREEAAEALKAAGELLRFCKALRAAPAPVEAAEVK